MGIEIRMLLQNCFHFSTHCDIVLLFMRTLLSLMWRSLLAEIKILLKVSKSRKQNTKFSHTPKNQGNFVHCFALASKKWLKQKIQHLMI